MSIESGGHKETCRVNNIPRQNAWPPIKAVVAHILDHGRRDVEDEVGHDCAAAGAGRQHHGPGGEGGRDRVDEYVVE